jgi:hypothetical protein
MITLTGISSDGKTKLLAIGLCDHHIAILKDDGGIRLTPQTHNVPEGMNIDIIYAPTEKDLLETLKTAGLITETTEVAVTGSPGKGNIVGLDQPIIPIPITPNPRRIIKTPPEPSGDAANN